MKAYSGSCGTPEDCLSGGYDWFLTQSPPSLKRELAKAMALTVPAATPVVPRLSTTADDSESDSDSGDLITASSSSLTSDLAVGRVDDSFTLQAAFSNGSVLNVPVPLLAEYLKLSSSVLQRAIAAVLASSVADSGSADVGSSDTSLSMAHSSVASDSSISAPESLVEILWDLDSVPFPLSDQYGEMLTRICAVASGFGQVARARVLSTSMCTDAQADALDESGFKFIKLSTTKQREVRAILILI